MPRRDWLFFYLYIFTPKSERQYAVWTYLVHLCFLLCLCVCVYVYAFLYVCGFYNYFFFSFVYCSVASSSLPSFGSPNFLLSHNNTLSDFLFVKIILPPFYLAFPVFLSLLVALFLFRFSPYPLFPSHEKNYPETRESMRDREVRRGGIWRIGWSEGSGEIIVYRRG